MVHECFMVAQTLESLFNTGKLLFHRSLTTTNCESGKLACSSRSSAGLEPTIFLSASLSTITFKASSIFFFWMTYLKDISNLYPEIVATFCSEIIRATEHLVNVPSAVSISFRSTASWCEFVAFVGSITGRLKIACSSPVCS